MSNFEIVGYCFLIFALIIYIINFKEINKEIIYRWCKAIKEGRKQYYLENYPKGYYLLKFNKSIKAKRKRSNKFKTWFYRNRTLPNRNTITKQ